MFQILLSFANIKNCLFGAGEMAQQVEVCISLTTLVPSPETSETDRLPEAVQAPPPTLAYTRKHTLTNKSQKIFKGRQRKIMEPAPLSPSLLLG